VKIPNIKTESNSPNH